MPFRPRYIGLIEKYRDRLQGQKTDHWMGYREYSGEGITTNRPGMAGFQAAGSAHLKRAR